MRIISSYILKEFISFLFYCILAFAVIFILIDTVENLDNFIDSRLSIKLIFLYYAFFLPYILILTLPVSMLLAVMFSLGRLIGDNEITAMKASGVSFYRILLPLYVLSFFVCILAMGFSEIVVPRTNLFRKDIKRLSTIETEDRKANFSFTLSKNREMDRQNVFLENGSGLIIYAQGYRSNIKRAENVFILEPLKINTGDGVTGPVTSSGFKSRIDADSLTFSDGAWTLHNVSKRIFTSEGETLSHYETLPAPFIQLEPSDFARIDIEPEEMDYFELSNYISQVSLRGSDASEWLVDLYIKIAFPFVSFVIVFFGAPLAAGSTIQGKTASFGIALVICFIYYSLINAFQILGRNGALHPMAAAWLPNGVFLTIGIIMHARASK